MVRNLMPRVKRMALLQFGHCTIQNIQRKIVELAQASLSQQSEDMES